MYSTCIYCNASLGANEAIESFPVGRRLAFDPAKGRLWAVCRSCARWNLTPLEERWEAIEEAERRFRDTRLRVSTENIGLAKLREGTELVRVGRALRPELAVWRYGSELIRRRRIYRAGQAAAWTGAIVGSAFAPGWGMWAGWVGASALMGAARWRALGAEQARKRLVLAIVPPQGERERHEVRLGSVQRIRLLPDREAGWVVRLQYYLGARAFDEKPPQVDLEGDMAVRALRLTLPFLNRGGGKRSTVDQAATQLEAHGTGAPFVAAVSARIERDIFKPRDLKDLSEVDRLALEMAVSEELEQQAMQGELAQLEHAWREAEEIAAIADDLFLPASVRRVVERHHPGAGKREAP